MSKYGVFWLFLLAACVLACRQPDSAQSARDGEILEVEDVGLPIDVALSTEEDVKGPPIISGVSGVLPSDYPRDLPTHEPSSIVDYGAMAAGWSFVELDTPSSADTVLSNLRRLLPAAGWSVSADSGTELRVSKASADVRVKVLVSSPGCRIRVEYR